MVEYALILAVVVLVAALSAAALGDATGAKIGETGTCVENPVVGDC